MNLYTSDDFLETVAKVYFPRNQWRIEDYELTGKVFRLLTVDDEPVIDQLFLDMHEPVDRTTDRELPTVRWLPEVSHGLVPLEEFRETTEWEAFDGAPTVVWKGYESWDDYATLLRKRRVLKDDQRRRRRLEELIGPIEFQVDDPADDVLPTCFEWKSARDRATQRNEILAVQRNRDFVHELQRAGLLRASTLRAGGKLLAIYLGSVYEGRWYGWVIASDGDDALRKYSLGRQILYPLLEESYRAGHDEFDFSIGFEPYKLFFATHARAMASLGIPPLGRRIETMIRKRLEAYPKLYERAKEARMTVRRLLSRNSSD
ncbi:MAG: GNAT family N-acetyltransferase [bacterium]|nr:GNAT family N-acetyltransferase [bacterium]